MLKARFKQHKLKCDSGGSKRSDLDIYLYKSVIEEERNLDILRWWKVNAERFPILYKITHDVLVVPI